MEPEGSLPCSQEIATPLVPSVRKMNSISIMKSWMFTVLD